MAFLPKQGGEPIELVATNVNEKGVVGYLLLPVTGNTGHEAPAAAETGAGTASQTGR